MNKSRENYLVERVKVEKANKPTEEVKLLFLYNFSGLGGVPDLAEICDANTFLKKKEDFYASGKQVLIEELIQEGDVETALKTLSASNETVLDLSLSQSKKHLDEFFKVKLTYTIDFSEKCDCGCEGPNKKLISVE